MDISIVIPVYNRADELRLSLQSLTRQTLSADRFEVVVADDGSAEDIPAVLAAFPGLRTVYARQPDEGFRVAAARNLGADRASGDIIVYSDNGILLKSDTLATHLARHVAGGESFVALANMYATGWDTDMDAARALLDAHSVDEAVARMESAGMGDGRGYMFESFSEDTANWYIPWQALWGGHFSVNARFVKAHNIRWNESFTSWGGEDNEYGIQLCDAGARLCFCRDIQVAHYPTPGSKAVTAPDEVFRENYKKVKQHILALHPTRAVETWTEIGGSGTNDPVKRAAFFAEKGWDA